MGHRDFEDESDEDDDDEDVYVSCPHCGGTMLEAADYCPSCQQWITSENVTRKGPAWWVVAIVIILIGMMVISAAGF